MSKVANAVALASPRDVDRQEWALRQAEALRAREWASLDVANLIEELESMAGSDLAACRSALARVVEHLLKLEYSHAAEPRRGWRASARNARVLAGETLQSSPSVEGKLDLDRIYRVGRELAVGGMEDWDDPGAGETPAACPYTLRQLLDARWWPQSRHGLRP